MMAGGTRVLYVDDEPDLLEITRIFLEQSGEFSVDIQTSAEKALEASHLQSYDAIISDYKMPGMDGIAFLKAVRGEYGDVPFILFTGRGREEVVIEAINNGADFYIQKGGDPTVQFAELAHKVRQAVRRKQAELTLAEQEQRYLDLQNASDLIQSVTPDGHFLFVNKKWLDTLGYREEDLTDLTISDIIHEESTAHCREIFQRVISGENVGIIDAVFRTKSGERICVEGIASCKMVEGKCRYTRGMFKDVSDRKKAEQELTRKNEELSAAFEEITAAEEELRYNYDLLIRKEEALRESSETFRAVVEQSNEGIVIADFTGKLLFANHRAADIVDSAGDLEMGGSINVLDFVNPASRADAVRDFGEVARGHDSYLVNYKILTQANREKWIECIGRKISFRESPAMLLSFRDITGRMKAEEELRESQDKFATVFKHNPVSLTLVLAEEGTFVDVNNAFVHNTGYSVGEVIGKTPGELGIFADKSECSRLVSELKEKHLVQGMEIQCRIKQGETRTCRFSSSIVLVDGKPQILSSVEDITEQKATESAFRALVSGLVGTTGRESLDRITESIGRWLGADCIMIGKVSPDRERVDVLSMILDGKKITGHSYALHGTPCENVTEKGFCLYPDNVSTLFPGSRDVREFHIRGFAGTPLRDPGGRVVGILSILTRAPLSLPLPTRETIDIIAAKAAAEIGRLDALRALSESEEMFRALVEYSIDGTLILDPTGKILFANQAAGQIIQTDTPDGIVGTRNVMEFIAPESREDALRDFSEVAKGIDGYLARYKVKTVKQEERWVESIGKTILFRGTPSILISLRDITGYERKPAPS